jgi:hypothetical protein
LVRRAGRSRLRRKKGGIERLYTQPPEGSVVVCLDEMGPESAKSFPGQQLVPAAAEPKIIPAEPRPDIPLAGPQPEVSSPVAQPHPLSDGAAQVQPEVKKLSENTCSGHMRTGFTSPRPCGAADETSTSCKPAGSVRGS